MIILGIHKNLIDEALPFFLFGAFRACCLLDFLGSETMFSVTVAVVVQLLEASAGLWFSLDAETIHGWSRLAIQLKAGLRDEVMNTFSMRPNADSTLAIS